MSNPNVVPRWSPSDTPYKDFIDKLKKANDGSYEAHLAKRRAKREMKKDWQLILDHNRISWLTDLNNALAKSMERALATGDIDDVKKIAEMLGINTKEDITVTLNEPLPFNDDFD